MVARKGSVTITRGVVSQINWMQLQSWTPTLGYRWKGERAPDRIGDRGPADRVKTVRYYFSWMRGRCPVHQRPRRKFIPRGNCDSSRSRPTTRSMALASPFFEVERLAAADFFGFNGRADSSRYLCRQRARSTLNLTARLRSSERPS